jgi:hypothetical protein
LRSRPGCPESDPSPGGGVLILYPLSIGPASWLNEHGCLPADRFNRVHGPSLGAGENGTSPDIGAMAGLASTKIERIVCHSYKLPDVLISYRVFADKANRPIFHAGDHRLPQNPTVN